MPGLRHILLVVLLFALEGVQAQPVRYITGSAPRESLDVRWADAQIWQIFSERLVDRYDEAAQLYLSLLTRLDDDASAEETAILLKHVRGAALVMPPAIRATWALDESVRQGTLDALPEGIGACLVQWWRRQDTLPATEANERLEEHLARLAFAAEAYKDPEDPRGFDDRGEIYVRFGTPDRQATIQINPAMLAFDYRDVAPPPQIPANEVWVYPRITDAAYYVFIQPTQNQPYHQSTASDLIPLAMRNGSDLRKVRLLLGILEEVYGQLALLHPDFGTVYDQVADYNLLPSPHAGRPDQFVQHILMQARTEDNAAEWRRVQEVPASHTETYGLAEDLIVPLRWARFLEPDGTTRTEVYWGLVGQALHPSPRLVRRHRKMEQHPSDQYILSVSIAQYAADYAGRSIQHKHYLVPVETDGVLVAKTLAIQGDTGRYHLAVQWGQRWTQANKEKPEMLEPGALLKISTLRLDSLEALHAEGRRLEMSDLKPLVALRSDVPGEGRLYPFDHLPPGSRLALYFELYHLTYGTDDQTHYTIAYQVTSQARRGRLPFSEQPEAGAAVQASYTGRDRGAREYIDLDLSAWQGKGDLSITVHVTDDVTGATTSRTITFAPSL